MKNKSPSIPSLAVSLGEYNFFISGGCLCIVKNLDLIFSNVLNHFLIKKMIKKFEVKPIKNKKSFSILYKIFNTDSKYFKFFFKFSEKGEFLGVSLNDDYNYLIFSGSISSYEEYLKNNFLNEINNIRLGIELEDDYNNFLKIFKEKNKYCVNFRNRSNDENYDPDGIDFEIIFKNGLMPLQIKGSSLYVSKHKKIHPKIPYIITSIGEDYEKRELNLLCLHDKYFSNK